MAAVVVVWETAAADPLGRSPGSCAARILWKEMQVFWDKSSSRSEGGGWKAGDDYKVIKMPYMFGAGHTALELKKKGGGASEEWKSVGFYPQNYTSIMAAISSTLLPFNGVLVSPDPITESRRRSGKVSEEVVVKGTLTDFQASILSELMEDSTKKTMSRRDGKVVEDIYPIDLKYRMVPFIGEGENCGTFLSLYFNVSCLLGIPGTAYPNNIVVS
eukprot:CAMPEP_0197526544 /NCGR_PEP_ID=MMETSP1318-20131121/18107_1 /TAXON_ID=552666 /ORGANISM="Partenskyella glossopodia, Strain RCC365" /LENGTH=215 /DNA_ID=CAMNT_0043080735 /DNA_START=55 /DNA_END=703 /DNA_ORIENTATION=-